MQDGMQDGYRTDCRDAGRMAAAPRASRPGSRTLRAMLAPFAPGHAIETAEPLAGGWPTPTIA